MARELLPPCYGTIFVRYKYVLLSLVNKELPGLWLDRIFRAERTLGRRRAEFQSHKSDAEEAGHVENEVTSHESCGRA